MKIIKVKYLHSNVKVLIDSGILAKINNYLNNDNRYFLLTDSNLGTLYQQELLNCPIDFIQYQVPSGENSKSITQVENIITQMLANNINQNDYLVAFGGGMITDLGGFVASIYKRGINFISMPTSLLAQVDSCLGGKNGINYHQYKNQIGTFYHPQLILVDPLWLNTLPKEELLSGYGEIVKYGLCFDAKLFNQLFSKFNLEAIIYQCLKIKTKITQEDEFEANIRIALNYGHTVAHAIESLSNYKVKHGIAVAYGLYHETQDQLIKTKLTKLYQILGINIDFSYRKSEIIKFIFQDKKVVNNKIKLPILKNIGTTDIVETNIKEFIRGLK